MKAALLLERLNLVSAFVPINMATGANTADWVSMDKYERCIVLLHKGAGANGEPPTITISQAKDNAGGSTKGLNFTAIWTQLATDVTTLAAWTAVTQAAASTYAPAAGDTQGLIAIEIEAATLDRANSFNFIQASVGDVGATSQIGGVLYILGDARFETTPVNLPDPRVA